MKESNGDFSQFLADFLMILDTKYRLLTCTDIVRGGKDSSQLSTLSLVTRKIKNGKIFNKNDILGGVKTQNCILQEIS